MSPKLSHFYGRSDSVGSIPEEDDTPGRRPYQPSDSDDESSSVWNTSKKLLHFRLHVHIPFAGPSSVLHGCRRKVIRGFN